MGNNILFCIHIYFPIILLCRDTLYYIAVELIEKYWPIELSDPHLFLSVYNCNVSLFSSVTWAGVICPYIRTYNDELSLGTYGKVGSIPIYPWDHSCRVSDSVLPWCFIENDRYLNSILSEWIIYGFPEESSRAGWVLCRRENTHTWCWEILWIKYDTNITDA
jgi:hypothetical protein